MTEIDQGSEGKWNAFVEAAFKATGLPDVSEDRLEIGTYTNRQIADRFRKDPLKLMSILMSLPGDDPVSKSSILSFAVDMIDIEFEFRTFVIPCLTRNPYK